THLLLLENGSQSTRLGQTCTPPARSDRAPNRITLSGARRSIGELRTRIKCRTAHATPSRWSTPMHSTSDALSYEGSVTAAMINGFSGTNKLVDGPALIAADGNVT